MTTTRLLAIGIALALTLTATSAEKGPITVESECGRLNCFEDSHINGHDITCESGGSEAACAQTCCGQDECVGFGKSYV